MSRFVQFVGLLGLTIFSFGVLTFLLLMGEGGKFVYAHLLLGAGLLLFFLLRGGLMMVGSAAVKRAAGYGAGVTVYTGLFVSILVLINYFFFRYDPLYLDSTEQKVFTLAPQTFKVLASLDQDVVARAFYVGGEVDPEVGELLDRIDRASARFSWQVVDPEKSPRLTEKYGISERDTVHFSFADGSSTREAKVVREIAEQDVTNAILKLTRGGEKKVYALSGHGESNLEDKTEAGYLFLKEAISGENITILPLDLSAVGAVPDDADALLVMAPRRALLPAERTIVGRYLASGGNALMLAEPNTVSEIAMLVAPLGIEVGNDIVLDQVLRLFEGPGVGVQPVVSVYGSHPAVADFRQNTVYSTVSSVRKAGQVPNGAVVTELAFTGDKSWVSTNLADIFGEQPTVVMPSEQEMGAVPIAAAFEGPVAGKSVGGGDHFFRNALGWVFGGAELFTGVPTAIQLHSRVLVIGDADFVANVNIRQLFNRDFFLNALNWVVGEQERVSIRARTLRASTQIITPEQFHSIFLAGGLLVPELLLIWGLFIWWQRRAA